MAPYEGKLRKSLLSYVSEVLKYLNTKEYKQSSFHVGLFNHELVSLQQVHQRADLIQLIDKLVCQGSTALFNTISLGYEYLRDSTKEGKKLCILLTDGHDNQEDLVGKDRVQRLLESNEVDVVLVGAGWNIDSAVEKYPLYQMIIHQTDQVDVEEIFLMISSISKSYFGYLE